MPTQRLSMRRIKEVLRLKHFQGLPERAIARSVGVSNGVVHSYLSRARSAGLSWPLPEGMTDEDLELLLFPAPRPASQSPQRPVPDWSYIDKELIAATLAIPAASTPAANASLNGGTADANAFVKAV
ncbi:hypothetical protein BwSH12_77310 [Bradyrhizobium ottawaense]|nr:hypothetical protein BwSH12_77310 [Bradyrhizobium ottawaense]